MKENEAPVVPPPDRVNLKLETDDLLVRAKKVETPYTRARRRRQFLPALPERHFCRLLLLPGRAWAVYLVALLRSRLEHGKTVTLTTCSLRRFGLTRKDKHHALLHLEKAGLLLVERRGRHNPLITLLDVPDEGGRNAD
jgi:hypothetical protein